MSAHTIANTVESASMTADTVSLLVLNVRFIKSTSDKKIQNRTEISVRFVIFLDSEKQSPYAGIIRIRYKGSAKPSQPLGHPRFLCDFTGVIIPYAKGFYKSGGQSFTNL
mgnify:CR=1 FL=1